MLSFIPLEEDGDLEQSPAPDSAIFPAFGSLNVEGREYQERV
jgi:hypothetical protein